MDPLTLATTPSASNPAAPHGSTSRTVHPKMEDGGVDDSFDSFCIVCDRLIIPPKEPENVAKVGKKKTAGGAIRVKNPDGSTTTRTANGAKITRPGLKRNTSSANRLAQVAAANSNAVKLHPLTRSKTAEPLPTHTDDSFTSPKSTTTSPQSTTTSPQSSKCFRSSIYCSKECCEEDAGRSSEAYRHLSRTFSNEFALPHPPFASEHGVYVADPSSYPHAPPSPLFISGSDTDSSTAGGPEGPACSAPKTLEYFRISRGGPDDAWRDHQRQRRSSMHQSMAPAPMTRQLSNHSSVHRGFGGMSSDSLSSLWNLPATEADLDSLTRVTSSTGQERVGGGRRSISSIQSDRSVPIPARLPRSGMSQTSLISGSPASIPPDQTLSLLQSYATHFPTRDQNGIPASYSSHKGFLPPVGSRRQSLCMTPQSRPDIATLRTRRSESGALTWDEFGLSEVEANNARARARLSTDAAPAPFVGGLSVPKGFTEADITPKQSLEVENGKWQVKYALSSHGTIKQRKRVDRSPTLSHNSSSSSDEDARPQVVSSKSYHLSPPARPLLPRSQSHNAPGHEMPPPSSIPSRAGIRLESPNSEMETTPRAIAPTPHPAVQSHASSVPAHTYLRSPDRSSSHSALPNLTALRLNSSGAVRCAPLAAEYIKPGFTWAEHEKKGGKMYELPSGMKIDRSKAGLFYFN